MNKNIDILDIITKKDLQKIQDKLSNTVQIPIMVTYPNGILITKPSNFSKFCGYIRTLPNLNYSKEPAFIIFNDEQRVNCKKCSICGLWSVGIKIVINECHVATWIIGQLKDSSTNDEELISKALNLGANKKLVIKYIKELKVMDPDKLRQNAEVICLFIQELYNNALLTNIHKKEELKYKNLLNKSLKYQQDLNKFKQMIHLALKNSLNDVWEYEFSSHILTSYAKDEKTSMPIDNFLKYVYPEDIHKIEPFLNKYPSNIPENFDFSLRLILEENKCCYERIEITPFEYDKKGNITKIVGFNRNVTKDKEQELSTRKAKEDAEKSNKLKSAILANMSHEIRTPLNSIVGFSHLLSDASDSDNKEKYLSIIDKNSNILLNLINDILDISKIDAGYADIKRTKVNITNIISDLKKSFYNDNPDLNIIFEHRFKKLVSIHDEERLKQILNNYLSNAKKFTPHGEIRMWVETNEKGLIFFVKDNGLGISKEKQPHIFQRFAKMNNFAQGTGLGLSICKALAQTVGGEVGFSSEEGIGSTFWYSSPTEIIEIERI
ncbi:MAG: PocR ligand-binding domain-containing protein [Bacteroidales bacterium]